MVVSTSMLVIFCVYIFDTILIGFITWRLTKNFDDYILGSRSLRPFMTALPADASDMSGWLLMGLPGAVFFSGTSKSQIAIGLALGTWISQKLMAGRLRVHTEHNNNALTLSDYFTGRFEDRSRILRIISALVILLFFTICCASGIVVGARLFEGTFGMSYEAALWVGVAATIPCTPISGFLAVSWTDTIQANLMTFIPILTPITVIIGVGGFGDSLKVIKQKNIENIDMLKGLNFVVIISLVGWGLDYFGQLYVLARLMAADSHHSTVYVCHISITWTILCLAGAVAAGFFGTAYFNGHPALAGTANQNAECMSIELAQILPNPWIAGILLSTVLAAVMSALSCQLPVCSSVIAEDLYKAFLHEHTSQKELVWVGHVMVLVVVLVAIAPVASPKDRMLGLVSYAWAGFGTAFGPVVLFSVMWPRTARSDVLVGMITDALAIIVWKQFDWLGLYEIIPGSIFGNIGIIVFNLLGKTLSVATQKYFIEVDTHYHSVPPLRL